MPEAALYPEALEDAGLVAKKTQQARRKVCASNPPKWTFCLYASTADMCFPWTWVYKSPKNSEPGAPSPAPRPRQAPAPRENSSSQAPKAAPLIEEIPPAPAGPVWANGQGVVGKTFGAFLYFCV